MESQTHAPFRHRLPTAHWLLLPHLQAPEVHWSDRSGSHGVHAAPAVPHAVVLGITHVFPAQQPIGQPEAVHPVQAPPEQVPGLQS